MPTLYERPDSPYWYAELQVGAAVKRVSTGVPRGKNTRKKALEVAEQREAEFREDASRRKSLSIRQAATMFLTDPRVQLKESTRNHYAEKLAILADTLDEPVLADMSIDWVKDMIRRRRQATSDIQVRKELVALSSCLEYAMDRGLEGAPEMNPTRLVNKKALGKPRKFPRWLTVHEMQLILAVVPKGFWQDFIRLVLETGLRHEEALGLQWSEVDLKRKVIALQWDREKAEYGRLIPLSQEAIRIISTQVPHRGCPFVFVNPRTRTRYKSIGSQWRKYRAKAGVRKARIHDIRHTFASWTRQSGMSREDRKDIMGHMDDITHGGYANASIETLVESVNKHSPNTLLTQCSKFYSEGAEDSL